MIARLLSGLLLGVFILGLSAFWLLLVPAVVRACGRWIA